MSRGQCDCDRRRVNFTSKEKKLKMSDEHVYRISWKFIGFAVFLDKILGKKLSNCTQNNLDYLQTI